MSQHDYHLPKFWLLQGGIGINICVCLLLKPDENYCMHNTPRHNDEIAEYAS